MASPTVAVERAVAGIFNSAIAAAAIGAAWEFGLLEAVREKREVDVVGFAEAHDLDVDSLQGLVTSLVIVDVLARHRDDNTNVVVRGRLLDEAYRTKSLFHWLSLGSGGLFSRMQHVVRNANRTADNFYSRDPVAIAYACRDINRHHFDPAFWSVVRGLDRPFTSVVDLGSGSGERLMQLLERYPGTTGLGVDISAPAVAHASAAAAERGLAPRLSFVKGDVRDLASSGADSQAEFESVDLLTCFMMGHDFWPRDDCVRTLRRLREAFPNARRFLLGDTTRVLLGQPRSRFSVSEDDVPVFTLAFELGHAMMGVYLPTTEEWEGIFEEGGWRCVKSHALESPSRSVIFELEPL